MSPDSIRRVREAIAELDAALRQLEAETAVDAGSSLGVKELQFLFSMSPSSAWRYAKCHGAKTRGKWAVPAHAVKSLVRNKAKRES